MIKKFFEINSQLMNHAVLVKTISNLIFYCKELCFKNELLSFYFMIHDIDINKFNFVEKLIVETINSLITQINCWSMRKCVAWRNLLITFKIFKIIFCMK